MTIFGLGGESPEHTCPKAVMAGANMLASLPAMNENLRSYLGGEFRLGIGTFGPTVTAIGDTGNVAARLESGTRKQQADLLISESLIQHLRPESCGLRNTSKFHLKGKTKKVTAHEDSLKNITGKRLIIGSNLDEKIVAPQMLQDQV